MRTRARAMAFRASTSETTASAEPSAPPPPSAPSAEEGFIRFSAAFEKENRDAAARQRLFFVDTSFGDLQKMIKHFLQAKMYNMHNKRRHITLKLTNLISSATIQKEDSSNTHFRATFFMVGGGACGECCCQHKVGKDDEKNEGGKTNVCKKNFTALRWTRLSG